jgi:hypothetical protein
MAAVDDPAQFVKRCLRDTEIDRCNEPQDQFKYIYDGTAAYRRSERPRRFPEASIR